MRSRIQEGLAGLGRRGREETMGEGNLRCGGCRVDFLSQSSLWIEMVYLLPVAAIISNQKQIYYL